MPSTATLAVAALTRWDALPALVAQRAAVGRAAADLQQAKDDLRAKEAGLIQRLSDPMNAFRSADGRALARLREASADVIEAAHRTLHDLEGQTYDVERRCREQWFVEYGDVCRTAHQQIVSTMLHNLTELGRLNGDLQRLMATTAGTLDLLGPIPNLTGVVAPWLRAARDAGFDVR